MRIVVGLGNPGAEYAGTRHNLGFRVVDGAAERLGAPAFRLVPEWNAAATRIETPAEPLLLVKPQTYMNRSGDTVAAVLEAAGEACTLDRLLVVTDDIHLPLGRMRLRAGGSCGGHNGLASVEAALASRDWPRLRLGVGPAPDPGPDGERLVEFVLGVFGPDEAPVADAVVDAAAGAVEMWSRESFEPCQGRINGWRAPGSEDEESASDTAEAQTPRHDP